MLLRRSARAEQLRDEFVIRASGEVKERGEGLANPNIDSGTIELVVRCPRDSQQRRTIADSAI